MSRVNVWDEYKDKLAGGWKCLSYEIFESDRPDAKLLRKPHGDAPLGRVLLSPNGFISALMATPDRMQRLESGKDWQTAPDAEVAHVGRGLGMYCGYLELYREDDGSLWWATKVEICHDPNRMAGLEKRKVKYFEEDGKAFMILQPFQDMLTQGNSPTRAILKWEKFE